MRKCLALNQTQCTRFAWIDAELISWSGLSGQTIHIDSCIKAHIHNNHRVLFAYFFPLFTLLFVHRRDATCRHAFALLHFFLFSRQYFCGILFDFYYFANIYGRSLLPRFTATLFHKSVFQIAISLFVFFLDGSNSIFTKQIRYVTYV